MPPVPALDDAATSIPKRREQHIPRNPTITQGKIPQSRAQAPRATKNAIPRAAPSDVPIAAGMHPGQRDGGRKPQSLPPPGEMTRHAEEDLRAARRADTRKKRSAANKPITAHQKMSAARATIGGERDNRDGKRGIGMPWNSARAKVPGLTKLLEMQSRSAGWGVNSTGGIEYIPFTNRFVSTKVLRFKETLKKNVGVEVVLNLTRPKAKRGSRKNRVETKKEEENETFRFMDLPAPVKIRVYRLVVVDSRLWVWPASVSDREQPDISMVCREIRLAVLPIYYGENTFAVDIAAPAQGVCMLAQNYEQASKRQPVTGLIAVVRWAEMMSAKHNEGGKWFTAVKQWCFSYRDPLAGFEGTEAAPSNPIPDESFVTSVRFPLTRREKTDKKIKIEVHRRAACVMPDWRDYGECAVMAAPDALYAAVAIWLQAGVQEPEALFQFVLNMRELVGQLSFQRCEKVRRNHRGDRVKRCPESGVP